uniref:Uncharacterized protein n=1 Tax=Geobacillus sp. (strain WCH70) TaxID=471223 RepID=C5D540_GEOSW
MGTVTKQHSQINRVTNSSNTVICRKCKSNQVVAIKRGYSFKTMFLVLLSMIAVFFILVLVSILTSPFTGIWTLTALILFLSLPISIFCGFIGRNSLVNGCMNCGNKWIAGKK